MTFGWVMIHFARRCSISYWKTVSIQYILNPLGPWFEIFFRNESMNGSLTSLLYLLSYSSNKWIWLSDNTGFFFFLLKLLNLGYCEQTIFTKWCVNQIYPKKVELFFCELSHENIKTNNTNKKKKGLPNWSLSPSWLYMHGLGHERCSIPKPSLPQVPIGWGTAEDIHMNF